MVPPFNWISMTWGLLLPLFQQLHLQYIYQCVSFVTFCVYVNTNGLFYILHQKEGSMGVSPSVHVRIPGRVSNHVLSSHTIITCKTDVGTAVFPHCGQKKIPTSFLHAPFSCPFSGFPLFWTDKIP